MGFLGELFKPKSEILKDKILATQKQRIMSLENEIIDVRNRHEDKEEELRTLRENHERAKERLIDQIVELSDKFAEINQRMLDIAHENARMKVLLNPPKKSEVVKLAKKKAAKK